MNPLPGRVYYYRNFKFPDGGVRNKYVVVLCTDPDDSDGLYVALTTSKDRSAAVDGCHSEHPACFYVSEGDTPMNGETRVMLDRLHCAKFNVLKKRCDHVGDFDVSLTADMLECGSTAYTLTGYERQQLKEEADLLRG